MREFFPLPETFERAVLSPGGDWRRERVPTPDLGSRDLLFRLILAGISPRDAVPAPDRDRFPSGLAVGEIAAVGDSVRGWNPLDRALLHPGEEPRETVDTELGEYVLLREQGARPPDLVKLPQETGAEDATLLPSIARAARILREASVPRGGRLLVVGLDLVGQVLVPLARHQRVERISALDPSPTLRAKAEWSGATRVIQVPEEPVRDVVLADTGGLGVHAAVVLLSDPRWLGEASRVLGPGGVLVVAVDFEPGVSLSIAPAWVHRNQMRIQGVRGFAKRDFREAMRAVGQGLVSAENLVSRRISWQEIESTNLTPGYWSHATHVLIEGPQP